jgi:hypothetical protein
LFSNFVCSSCRETIKAIYGSHSKELDNFNRSLRIWAVKLIQLALLILHKVI